MHNVYIKDGGLYRLGDGDPDYYGCFTSGDPIDIQYTNPANGSTHNTTAYPIGDEGRTGTGYVSKENRNGRIFYIAWDLVYNEELDKDVWEPFANLVQLHIKKYGRDGKVLSSIFPGVSYDGESVTYNPTREPYSVGDYSGETWVERFSAYTEYLPTNAVGGVDANGAYVTSLDNPSVKNPSAVPGNEDWHFIFGDGPVFYIPKGTKKVIFAYPLPDPVA
jgi:hypothetical protein